MFVATVFNPSLDLCLLETSGMVQVGDKVVSIDGRRVADMGLREALEYLNKALCPEKDRFSPIGDKSANTHISQYINALRQGYQEGAVGSIGKCIRKCSINASSSACQLILVCRLICNRPPVTLAFEPSF
jgi:hypothetical protein